MPVRPCSMPLIKIMRSIFKWIFSFEFWYFSICNSTFHYFHPFLTQNRNLPKFPLPFAFLFLPQSSLLSSETRNPPTPSHFSFLSPHALLWWSLRWWAQLIFRVVATLFPALYTEIVDYEKKLSFPLILLFGFVLVICYLYELFGFYESPNFFGRSTYSLYELFGFVRPSIFSTVR